MCGKTGAKRQSFAAENPRELMASLCERYPNWSQSRIFEACNNAYDADADLQRQVYLYQNTNIWNAMHRSASIPSVPPPRYVRTAEVIQLEETKTQERIKEYTSKVTILGLMMPNGKTLGKCTGHELEKMGGAFISIGRRTGKRLVESVWTEQSMSEAMKAGMAQ